jgi:hypothetical protein
MVAKPKKKAPPAASGAGQWPWPAERPRSQTAVDLLQLALDDEPLDLEDCREVCRDLGIDVVELAAKVRRTIAAHDHARPLFSPERLERMRDSWTPDSVRELVDDYLRLVWVAPSEAE